MAQQSILTRIVVTCIHAVRQGLLEVAEVRGVRAALVDVFLANHIILAYR